MRCSSGKPGPAKDAAGLLSAYAWDTSAGATIVLYAAGWYSLSLVGRALLKR